MSHVMVAARTCAGKDCENPLVKRHNESAARFEARIYCGRSCASKGKAQEGRERVRAERRKYLIGEVEFLVGTDTPDSLARRLGYANLDNLADALIKWGRRDLAAKLASLRPEPEYVCTPAARMTDEGDWVPSCTCLDSMHVPEWLGRTHKDDKDALDEARRILKEGL